MAEETSNDISWTSVVVIVIAVLKMIKVVLDETN